MAGQSGSEASVANTSNLLYISLSFGFSLAVNAWIFFRISGGLFNPAVSLAMALVGALTPLRALLLSICQILGGITGAATIHALLPGTLNVRTMLSAQTSIVRGLFIEMFMTSLLMLAILLLAAEKHKATFIAPIGIGLALFIAEMLGVYYTGGSLNPARSFGPSVVLRTFTHYHWIYWLGPAMGATIAAGFYKFIKYLEYETVLGPEIDDDVPQHQTTQEQRNTLPVSQRPVSMQPAETNGSLKRQMVITGPGLDDLLTRAGLGEGGSNRGGFYDTRLERIENMLTQLLGQRSGDAVDHTTPQTTSINTDLISAV